MNRMRVTISKDYKIQLPIEAVKKMLLKEGDSVMLQFIPEKMTDKCFVIQEEGRGMTSEEYFCIPTRMMEGAGLVNQDIQVILGDEELTITSSANIIKAMPTVFYEALREQEIDFLALADGVAERMNEDVLESEEDPV